MRLSVTVKATKPSSLISWMRFSSAASSSTISLNPVNLFHARLYIYTTLCLSIGIIMIIFFLWCSNTRVDDYNKLSRNLWSWKEKLYIPVRFLRLNYFRRSPELGDTSSFCLDSSPRLLNLLRSHLFAQRCLKMSSKSKPLSICYQLLKQREWIIAGFKSRAKLQMIEKSRYIITNHWLNQWRVLLIWLNLKMLLLNGLIWIWLL